MTKEDLRGLLLGVAGSVFATTLIVVVKRGWGGGLEEWERPLLFVGYFLLACCACSLMYQLAVFLAASRIEPKLRDRITTELKGECLARAEAEIRSLLRTQVGLGRIFGNFGECQEEILQKFRSSRSNRIFLQLGRTVLQGRDNFYDRLEEVVSPGSEVRILHASHESPYLSERAAHTRPGGGKNKYVEWSLEIDYAVRKIEALAKAGKGMKLEGRQHREGFIWRLFIFDDAAFIQPYLSDRNNSANSPVLEFLRRDQSSLEDNEKSLYRTFANYFDLKWEENVAERRSLAEYVPEGSASVVAAVVRYHQFFIFAIPRRYIDRSGSELPFHGIGGKRRANEGWLEALGREAGEEMQAQLKVVTAARTRYLTTGAELPEIEVEENPRPYCIYKRTRAGDPNFYHPEVTFLVGYDAEVQATRIEDLRPNAEIGALVVLTGEMLKRTLHGHVHYSEIVAATDGSRLILAKDARVELNRKAVPAGLATIVATEYHARLTRRL